MCDFKQLYCGTDGYVVRCNQCGYYQVGFSSFMLTLSESDFEYLCQSAAMASCRLDYFEDEYMKQVVIPTPYSGMNILLNIPELQSFIQMLDAANVEKVSLAFINLFESKKY